MSAVLNPLQSLAIAPPPAAARNKEECQIQGEVIREVLIFVKKGSWGTFTFSRPFDFRIAPGDFESRIVNCSIPVFKDLEKFSRTMCNEIAEIGLAHCLKKKKGLIVLVTDRWALCGRCENYRLRDTSSHRGVIDISYADLQRAARLGTYRLSPDRPLTPLLLKDSSDSEPRKAT